MRPMSITEDDIRERDEYCSVERFRELLKKSTFDELVNNDIILYAVHVRNLRPLAWQFKVLKEYNKGVRKFVICCSRQIGKTELAKLIEQFRADTNAGWKDRQEFTNQHKTTEELIISITEDSAYKVLRTLKSDLYTTDKKMASYKNNKGKEVFGKKWMSSKLSNSKSENTQSKITFRSNRNGETVGCSIKSIPATNKILGNTFTGFVADEASRLPDTIITENLLPTIKAYGTFELYISTPYHKSGYFYNIVDPDEKYDKHKYARFMFDIDAIKEELPVQHSETLEEINDLRASGSGNEVNRNYYCSFTSGDDLYFDLEKVGAAFDETLQQMSEYRGRNCILGIDFGGMTKSSTVLTLVTEPANKEEQSLRIACWKYPPKKDMNFIEDIKNIILPNFNITVMIPEQCPPSVMHLQMMEEAGFNIKPFNTNRASKQDYMNRFRSYLSTGRLKTYRDSQLLDELNNFNTDMKPMNGSTDDMIDSWMLACTPFMNERVEYASYIIGGDKHPLEMDEVDRYDAMLREEGLKKEASKEYYGLSRVI